MTRSRLAAAGIAVVLLGTMRSPSARGADAPVGGPPAAKDNPKALPGVDQALQDRINRAIARGVEHLNSTQGPAGSWRTEFGSAGPTGLALFTLLSSGVSRVDPAVVRAARFLAGLDTVKGTMSDLAGDRPPAMRMTYDHALRVLALTAHSVETHRVAIGASVRALVSAQKPSGQWAYTITMGGPLDHGDNSNTQFALLALWQADVAGFSVPNTVWQRALRHFESTADREGGWGYGCPGTLEGSYGSMTAVGVACSVIAKAMLLGKEKAGTFDYTSLPVVARGLRWLGARFTADRHPGIDAVTSSGPGGGRPGGPPGGAPGGGPGAMGGGPPGGMPGPSARTFQYYWLYAAERVGMLLSLRRLGEHDWYREGAEWLVSAQRPDGSWHNEATNGGAPEPPLAATCFALLFLERATPRVVTER